MSFKLQDRIQGLKGLPGKYKRVLLAMAKRARNDGTNIIASKETLGNLAGVSERTAYRIIDELIESGAVVKALTHECARDKYPNCKNGDKHITTSGNHWTQPYNINIEGLGCAVEKLQNFSKFRQESRKPGAPRTSEWHDILTLDSYGEWYDILSAQWGDILAESGLPFCHAKQGSVIPAPLGQENKASATDVAVVSESVSESVAPAPPSPLDRPNLSREAEAILFAIYPYDEPQGLDYRALESLVTKHKDHMSAERWLELIEWNRTHKPPALVYRSLEKFLAGVEYSLNDFQSHESERYCRVCRPKPKAGTHAAVNPELHDPRTGNWLDNVTKI